LVEFPSNQILAQAFQNVFGVQKGIGKELLRPAIFTASTDKGTTQQLFSISKAFGGRGRVGEKIPGLNVGQLQFLLSERLQQATGQIQFQQAQQAQQKAETDFLSKIQGLLEQFTVGPGRLGLFSSPLNIAVRKNLSFQTLGVSGIETQGLSITGLRLPPRAKSLSQPTLIGSFTTPTGGTRVFRGTAGLFSRLKQNLGV